MIFDYIHIAQCRQLLFLVWYDDLTYADQESVDRSTTKKAFLLFAVTDLVIRALSQISCIKSHLLSQ